MHSRERQITVTNEGIWKNTTGAYSVLVNENDTIIYGTLVFYPENSQQEKGMFDVHYLDKHVAVNRHPSGFLKSEHRKPTKYRVTLARFIDRSIRPLITDHRNFQLIIRLMNYRTASPYPACITAASNLLQQAGLLDAPLDLYYVDHDPFYLALTFYKNKVVMLEGCCDNMPDQEVLAQIKTAYDKQKEYNDKDYCLVNRFKVESRICEGSEKLILAVLMFQKMRLKLISYRKVFYMLKSLYNGHMKYWIFRVFQAYCRYLGRFDGRAMDEIRTLTIVNSALSQPFTSSLVLRGHTKVLSRLTWSYEPQVIDEAVVSKKDYLNVQYEMLGCSVGEVSRTGMSNRREIGHGEIIRHAVQFVTLPSEIALFIQNDVLACAGSSSMAGTIGTSLCLYQAGITSEMVAGITVGNITGKTLVLDIMEAEDWMGMMDLKITGTYKGLTGFQMDCKYMLLQESDLVEAIKLARKGLNFLLDKMHKSVVDLPVKAIGVRTVKAIKVPLTYIKNIIGYQGHNIKRVTASYNVKIQVNQTTGKVEIIGVEEDVVAAITEIQANLEDPVTDKIYVAEVVKTLDPDRYLIQPQGARSGSVNTDTTLQVNQSVKVELVEKRSEGKLVYKLHE